MHSTITITQRQLIASEALLVELEMPSYPDLTYVSAKRLLTLPHVYVVEVGGVFAGLCGVYKMKEWVKIGPLAVLTKFHRHGLGKALISQIVKDFSNEKILILSSNKIVQRIVLALGFKQLNNYHVIPWYFRTYLFKQFLRFINIKLIVEKVRKSIAFKPKSLHWYVLIK
ncbi:MAG TPA: GNAT family N-acetyltransferase [Candidatus Woesebacteria bacterium]|nr:GNAT family N-acetyltransferase [Candidatus Woesebacteria bacterium]HNS94614.1 GNAT family N-acetyltransferase [Candidatus Woesebacteria bacterium]